MRYDQDKADWSGDLRNTEMIQSIPLTNWMVIFWANNRQETYDFIHTMQWIARPLGMHIGDPQM